MIDSCLVISRYGIDGFLSLNLRQLGPQLFLPSHDQLPIRLQLGDDPAPNVEGQELDCLLSNERGIRNPELPFAKFQEYRIEHLRSIEQICGLKNFERLRIQSSDVLLSG